MPGALQGLKIVEMEGIGPAPFAGMMLADHGAEVVLVRRLQAAGRRGAMQSKDILSRSRTVVELDLKTPAGIAGIQALAATADGLIEGFRPGVMERLGLGPEVMLSANPRLVYGRMTGWGQTGPYAEAAGHDINYIALAGNLHGYGRAGAKPTPPVNAVGDFGGGGMLLAFGMLAGILSAQRSGQGQVIDCAMLDGAALLASMIWSFRAMGTWRDERGVNLLDTGAPFYDSYETADHGFVAIGALEPQFYALFLERTGLAGDPDFAAQNDARSWPAQRARLTAMFKSRTRAQWCEMLEMTDACFAPVLSMAEAPAHPHNLARGTFVTADGVLQPAPAPRFSATPAVTPRMPSAAAPPF
jgi:alpha-methylacyl-CoA racemase